MKMFAVGKKIASLGRGWESSTYLGVWPPQHLTCRASLGLAYDPGTYSRTKKTFDNVIVPNSPAPFMPRERGVEHVTGARRYRGAKAGNHWIPYFFFFLRGQQSRIGVLWKSEYQAKKPVYRFNVDKIYVKSPVFQVSTQTFKPRQGCRQWTLGQCTPFNNNTGWLGQ